MFCFMLLFPLSPLSEHACACELCVQSSDFELCVVMSAFVGFPDVKFTSLNALKFTVESPLS